MSARTSPLRTNLTVLIRTFHGGNVREAGKKTGIPQQTLHRLVHGIGKRAPNGATILALTEAYRSMGITADWLLTGNGELPPTPDVALDPAGRFWVNPRDLLHHA